MKRGRTRNKYATSPGLLLAPHGLQTTAEHWRIVCIRQVKSTLGLDLSLSSLPHSIHPRISLCISSVFPIELFAFISLYLELAFLDSNDRSPAGRHRTKTSTKAIHNTGVRPEDLPDLEFSTRPHDMGVPDYGAAPLAKFFLIVRIVSLIAMVCIVGITANFVSEIVSTNTEPPREVVATLAIVSFVYL